MKARKLTLALVALASVGVASIATAAAPLNSGRALGVSGNVITACVESSKASVARASRGDLKLNSCAPGSTKLSWNIKGRTGDRGAAGAAGAQGGQGAAGPQGAQGATGATGAAGTKGETGATGPAGPAGAVGPAGAKGDKGDTGTQGVPGVAGIVDLESDGPYPGRTDSQWNLQNLGTGLSEGAQSTALWNSGDAIQQSWVMCPAGKVATGGGFGNNDGGQQDALNIVTSAPIQITATEVVGGYTFNIDAYDPIDGDEAGSFQPNGWLVEGYFTGEGSTMVRPHVICAALNG